jgi:hypothetical protein
MSSVIQVGVENNPFEGRSQAWMLDYPGCFACGKDAAEALLNVPQRLLNYRDWVGRHTSASWMANLGDFDIRLIETWDVYRINEKSQIVEVIVEVESFFQKDRKPLNAFEGQQSADLLQWGREDLLELVKDLNCDLLDRKIVGERWSIRGILSHIADADWYYLRGLDPVGYPPASLPGDTFERLQVTRDCLLRVLPQWIGIEKVVGETGELWSPRKVIRRAVCHEFDHIEHICKLL